MSKNTTPEKEIQEKFLPKKNISLKVAESMSRIEMWKRSERVHNCGTILQWENCNCGQTRKLKRANFCKDRLCPICNWRRSRLLAKQCSNVLHTSLKRQKLRFLHLTLTVRNVDKNNLNSEVDKILEAFKLLFKYKQVKTVITGFIRNLEITYNPKRNDYHPHIHVLIAVKQDYFKNGKAGGYIPQNTWAELWQRTLDVDYTPSVFISAIKPKKIGADPVVSAALEVAKYGVKDTDVLYSDDVLWVFANVLHARRLIAFGGLLKNIRSELNCTDVEADAADLVGLEKCENVKCLICNSNLFEIVYTWSASGLVYEKSLL